MTIAEVPQINSPFEWEEYFYHASLPKFDQNSPATLPNFHENCLIHGNHHCTWETVERISHKILVENPSSFVLARIEGYFNSLKELNMGVIQDLTPVRAATKELWKAKTHCLKRAQEFHPEVTKLHNRVVNELALQEKTLISQIRDFESLEESTRQEVADLILRNSYFLKRKPIQNATLQYLLQRLRQIGEGETSGPRV